MTGTRIWALGTAVLIVAILALGYLLGISPMLARLSAAELELANAEANNQAQLGTLQVMKAQFEDLESLESELEVLRISIPGAVDTDFVYSLLAGYQSGTGTNVTGITTGEAQPYGAPTDGEATEAVATIPNLYTVPVTITFTDNTAAQVLSFVAAMQRGPRLFLVTSVTGSGAAGAEGGSTTATVTAFMFVLADPEATADDASAALLEHGFDVAQTSIPLGPKPTSTPTPTPTPSDSATPTPTPTPTGTPAP